MKFLCYAKCSTCQKASKWLKDRGVSFTSRCIKSDNPRPDELIEWADHVHVVAAMRATLENGSWK